MSSIIVGLRLNKFTHTQIRKRRESLYSVVVVSFHIVKMVTAGGYIDDGVFRYCVTIRLVDMLVIWTIDFAEPIPSEHTWFLLQINISSLS